MKERGGVDILEDRNYDYILIESILEDGVCIYVCRHPVAGGASTPRASPTIFLSD